jgi:hypothetical protein
MLDVWLTLRSDRAPVRYDSKAINMLLLRSNGRSAKYGDFLATKLS